LQLRGSIRCRSRCTNLSLEPAFWDALKAVARARGLSLNRLIEEIDRARADDGTSGNLSSAVRVFVLDEARAGRA